MGDQLVSGIVARTRLLRDALAEVPYVGTPEAGLSVSDAVVARHAALVAALDATDGLDVDWKRLTIGAVAASNMSRILAEHDRLVVAAADRGSRAKYADAIKVLDRGRRRRSPRPGRSATAERHGRRDGPRRVADPQREVRRRAPEPVQGDLEGRHEGHQGDARGGRTRRPRREPSCHRTRAAWS